MKRILLIFLVIIACLTSCDCDKPGKTTKIEIAFRSNDNSVTYDKYDLHVLVAGDTAIWNNIQLNNKPVFCGSTDRKKFIIQVWLVNRKDSGVSNVLSFRVNTKEYLKHPENHKIHIELSPESTSNPHTDQQEQQEINAGGISGGMPVF
jgi:hypothetical protein